MTMIVVLVVIGLFFLLERNVIQQGLQWLGAKKEEQELLSRMSRFEGLPGEPSASNEEALRKRIESSSVVAFSELQERNGKGERVVVEVFKLRTGVDFFYELGDSLDTVEWADLRSTPKRYIHFFRGNPASSASGMSIHRGLLLKQRDLPESFARRLIKESQNEGRLAESRYFIDRNGKKFEMKSWDQLVAGSCKVILGRVEIEKGSRTTFVEEIFQLDASTPVRFQVGQKMGKTNAVEENVGYGEGTLVFYDRELDFPRSTMSISEGRISGMGGMPVKVARERLLKLVEEGQKSPD